MQPEYNDESTVTVLNLKTLLHAGSHSNRFTTRDKLVFFQKQFSDQLDNTCAPFSMFVLH